VLKQRRSKISFLTSVAVWGGISALARISFSERLTDAKCRSDVSVVNVSAVVLETLKRFIDPFSETSARGTTLRSITGVYIFDYNTGKRRFIVYELLELIERP
jgi:hypothetical protein